MPSGYTVGQLYDRFHESLHVQRTVDVKEVRNWIEEAQYEIAKLFGKVEDEEYLNVSANDDVGLPGDCLRVAEVRMTNGGTYRPYRNYMVTPYDQIVFLDSGDYKVYYHKVPDPLVGTPDEEAEIKALYPEVHPMFHLSIVEYLLFKYWDKNSEGEAGEKNYAESYHQKFREEAMATAQILMIRATGTRGITDRFTAQAAQQQ